jgi:hypothetical protein
MEAALLYLLKANVVLALFVVAYYGLLRRLTFFRLNRGFLLFALLFAAVYPAVPMPGLLPAEAPVPARMPATWVLTESPATSSAAAALPVESSFDWAAIALLVYAAGAGLLLARLLVQLLALARLRRTSRPATTATDVPYRELPAPGDPFSFGRTIYLHAAQHPAAELAVVLAHEQAHVRQVHTLDVLLAHLGTALFWLNPAAWLLRRAVLDNLEYLADAATLRTGLDRRAYQYCLLQLSRGTAGPALALPFTFFTLKNRVAMMNTPLSSRGQLARYFLAGPLVMLAALGYSAAHAREAEPTELTNAKLPQTNRTDSKLTSPVPATASPSVLTTALAPGPASKARAAAPQLPLAARRYLASTYPQAKVTGLTMGRPSAIASSIYIVTLVQQEKKLHLGFDSTGRFLGERKGIRFLHGPISLFTLPTSTKLPTQTEPVANATAPAGRTQTGPDPLCYLDGQVITMAQFKALNASDIYHTYFFEGEQARRAASEKGYSSIMVVTTKANKNTPAVVEFNQRMERLYAPPFQAPSTTLITTLPDDALYYLDGQPSTKQAVEQLVVKTIANVEVVSDKARIHRIPGLGDSPATSVVLVTTKVNGSAPAVQDFATKADLASTYTSRPVGVNVLVPAALAYITSHYPNARLNEVQEQKQKTTGAVKYQVQLINGKRPFYVYFTPQGEFAGE